MKELLVCVALIIGLTTSVFVPLDDPNIEYDGRWNLEASPVEAWSDTGFRFGFTNTTEITIKIKDLTETASYLTIWLDGTAIFGGINSLDGLHFDKISSDTAHTLRVAKRNEVGHGANRLDSIELIGTSPQTIPYYPKREQRTIEFIGDSLTCGYGILGPNATCHWSLDTVDATKAYGELVSTYFNAKLFVECWSGIGITRNYGDKTNTSLYPLPYHYQFTTTANEKTLWDFSKHPDFIVINLGANDYSPPKEYWPSDEGYVNALVSFANGLLKHTPNAKILFACWNGLSICPLQQKVAQIVGGYAVKLPAMDRNHDLGCDGHPNINGAIKMAETIKAEVHKIMGW